MANEARRILFRCALIERERAIELLDVDAAV
jgi:hypothetical protein